MIKRILFLVAALYGTQAQPVTFQVSTSDELQAALTAASNNGGDDEILLAAGVYRGNFKFISQESAGLVIRAADAIARDDVVLDGEYRAYVFRFDARDFATDLTIAGITLTRGKSEVAGGALSLKGNAGELLLDNLEVIGNYAPEDAGLSASGWTLITMRESAFRDNGKYENPSTTTNAPGGSGAAHAKLSATQITVEDNDFGYVAANFDPATMDNSFDPQFNAALSLAVEGTQSNQLFDSNDLDCTSQLTGVINVSRNRFANFGTVQVEINDPAIIDSAGGYQTLPVVRSVLGANADCLSVAQNAFKEIELIGSLLELGATKLEFVDNVVSNSAVQYASSLSANSAFGQPSQLVFSNNRVVNVRQTSEYAYGNYLFKLSGPVEFRGNVLRDLAMGVDVGFMDPWLGEEGAEVLVEDNLFANVGTLCSTRVSGSKVGIFNNTVYRTKGSGICVETSDNTELVVANNIAWPSPTVPTGLDIERIGYGLQSTLKNNIFLTASELWDIEEANLNLDPNFFDPESGDLHVASTSPAINAGNNDYSSGNPTDLDGNARVLDGNVDVGAYERSTTALHPADTDGNSVISQAEFDAYNTAWRTNEPWTSAPEVIPVDYVTRAGYLLQKGGIYKNIGVGKPATWVPESQ